MEEDSLLGDSLGDLPDPEPSHQSRMHSPATQLSDGCEGVELRELRRKYAITVNGIQRMRSDLDSAKRDVEKMRRVLEREVGVDAVEEALTGRGGWQGRAEEISDLKRRLKQALAAVPAVSVVVDQRRVAELEKELCLVRSEAEESSRVKKALKSRNDNLKSQLQRMKMDMKVLLEKDAVNDELIRHLQSVVVPA